MSKTVWTVERIQLFFYNGCDNRWVMFEEALLEPDVGDTVNPGVNPESFYRVQIIRLLTTIRAALTKHKDQLEKLKEQLTPQQLKDLKLDHLNERPARVIVNNNAAQRSKIKINLANSGDAALREVFVDYCKRALHREGVRDDKLTENLKDLTNSQKNFETLVEGGYTASNLLSVLPIARDWDVFGYLHPMSTGRTRYIPETFWWRHFVYRVSFTKTSKPERTPVQPFLTYDVGLQLLGDDRHRTDAYLEAKRGESYAVKKFTIDPDPTREIPYFSFAKTRDKPTTRNGEVIRLPMTEEEFKLYELYAAVIDAVQEANSGDKGTGTNGNSAMQAHSYYVVYPVIACGYYHFVQLNVRPDHLSSGESCLLRDCQEAFQDFLPIGQGSYHILKESIRELLVQIRLSTFQYHVEAWITKNATDILGALEKETDKFAINCFCELAPLLNEMRAITKGAGAWAHVGDSQQDTVTEVAKILRPWASVSETDVIVSDGKVTDINIPNGSNLKRDNYRVTMIPKVGIEMWLFHQGQEFCFDEECFAGTNETRLMERFEMVRARMLRFWHAGRP